MDAVNSTRIVCPGSFRREDLDEDEEHAGLSAVMGRQRPGWAKRAVRTHRSCNSAISPSVPKLSVRSQRQKERVQCI